MENYHEACFNMDVGNEIMVESNTVQICQRVWFTRKPLRKLDVRCVARCWSCTRWSFTSVWKPRKSRRRNMQQASMHDGVMVCFFLLVCVCVCLCFVACVWLHTFPSLLPSLHACMHALHARMHYIMHIYLYVHVYKYMHQTYSTYIDILYTYTHTCIYIHIHSYTCMRMYSYIYIHGS